MTQTCIIENEVARGSAARFVPDPADDTGAPEEVADGVFFLQGGTHYFRDGTQSGPAGTVKRLMCNNGWVVLGDHVLLVDANMPGRADALLAAVRSTTDKPIRYVLNTHHHGDHVYGNRAIVDRTGATVIASSRMVEELKRYETGAFGGPPGRFEQVAMARPDVAATSLLVPTETFDRSRVLTGSDGREARLLHLGMGHTRGDAIVWLPKERVMFVGDLVANGPYNIVRDAEMAAWTETLAALQALGPISVLPGHGARAGAHLLQTQRAFFVALIREVSTRAATGQSRGDVIADIDRIRAALLRNTEAAAHVIPREADLPVLSLVAQIERTFDQLRVPAGLALV